MANYKELITGTFNKTVNELMETTQKTAVG